MRSAALLADLPPSGMYFTVCALISGLYFTFPISWYPPYPCLMHMIPLFTLLYNSIPIQIMIS